MSEVKMCIEQTVRERIRRNG